MPQTTSFELSKQLYEVAKSKGYELPDSIHYWLNLSDKPVLFQNSIMGNHYEMWGNMIADTDPINLDDWDLDSDCTYHSYTTDELLAVLPETITTLNHKKENDEFMLSLFKLGDLFGATYENLYREPRFKVFEDTPSNALCKLFIYLLENDLMP